MASIILVKPQRAKQHADNANIGGLPITYGRYDGAKHGWLANFLPKPTLSKFIEYLVGYRQISSMTAIKNMAFAPF
jgi:hypothetical protein